MSSFDNFETVEVARDGALARVTLNRPDALNALNAQCATELATAIDELGGDDEVRCVLLCGAGRAFSSGADLKDSRAVDAEGNLDLGARLRELYHPVIHGLREMPKPVIAAVNGGAVGVGCSVALACDLLIAAESAYFLLAFVNIGLVPDGGATALVPARAGFARAAEMAMLGERIDSQKALDWGLVNEVVPDADLLEVATALGKRLADGPTRSYAGTKALLNKRLYAGLDDQLEAEAAAQKAQGLTGDFAEGVMAFLEKRDADFNGR